MSQGDFQPWQIHEPDSRIGYMVSYLTNMHTTFAQTKQTPFLHRHLYRGIHATPRPLLAAYTAISAYAGRTNANKGWAIRATCEGAAEVLKSAKDPAASAAMTGHEKLARTQALWLLQTIRCFDGDVAMRAQGERDMEVLKRWLKELEGLRDNLDDVHLLDDLALRQRPPRSWEVWVFNECVRRTVLMGHIFTSLFEILKAAGESGKFSHLMLPPFRCPMSRINIASQCIRVSVFRADRRNQNRTSPTGWHLTGGPSPDHYGKPSRHLPSSRRGGRSRCSWSTAFLCRRLPRWRDRSTWMSLRGYFLLCKLTALGRRMSQTELLSVC